MTKNLSALAIAAVDELNKLSDLQELISLSLEQFEHPDDKTALRVELLLGVYQSFAGGYLNELNVCLSNLNLLLGN